MIHPDVELRFINEHIGHGLVASRLIPRGTITWARDALDQVFTAERAAALPPLQRSILEKYSYIDPDGTEILCWDLARYVNHSCDPSCMSPGWDFEVAIRDIHPGEQLTDDYASLNIPDSFTCACGSPRCRGSAAPEDYERMADRWDAILAEVVPLIKSVPQPLWPLVKDPVMVEKVIAGELPVPSCRDNQVG